MSEHFNFTQLAALYDDTLRCTTGGYIQNFLHPVERRICRDVIEVVDLTSDDEATLHRMQCAVCSDFVESCNAIYPIVKCAVCNHGQRRKTVHEGHPSAAICARRVGSGRLGLVAHQTEFRGATQRLGVAHAGAVLHGKRLAALSAAG